MAHLAGPHHRHRAPAWCPEERRQVLPQQEEGAQRASGRKARGTLIIAFIAALIAVGGVVTDARPTEAGNQKVVIVVGPSGVWTNDYLRQARSLAHRARSYGANVISVKTPHATWERVKRAARNADLFVYLGHGNGWPSPYAPFQPYTKNGLGLNARAGSSSVKYWGEHYVQRGLRLAQGSVVLLIGACYSAGNTEGVAPTRSASVAFQRVDNYASGFLRTGARAVVANVLGDAGYLLRGLFTTNKSMREIFWSSPDARGTYSRSVPSRRSPDWARGIVDPFRKDYYYRSIMGDLDYRASAWR